MTHLQWMKYFFSESQACFILFFVVISSIGCITSVPALNCVLLHVSPCYWLFLLCPYFSFHFVNMLCRMIVCSRHLYVAFYGIFCFVLIMHFSPCFVSDFVNMLGFFLFLSTCVYIAFSCMFRFVLHCTCHIF